MELFTLIGLISTLIPSLGIGLALIIKPAAAIELQRRFYEKINWKIEPVSMKKEIRNTRIMGTFLVIIAILTIITIFIKVI